MNIQRKYSLPNCTLLLEGFSDVTKNLNFQELRPELSILVNAECYLSSYTQPITGGREFFESLVRAVSGYAQEVFSNIPNPQAHNHDSGLVELQQLDSNRHRLIIHAEVTPDHNGNSGSSTPSEIEIELNTVQLFDLVEAIDQFFADSQTLPELSLELHPVTRNYGGGSEALIKQAVPLTVGISSLAVAAIAFSLVPPPKIQPSEIKQNEQSNTTTPSITPTASSTSTPEIKDLEALIKSVPEITGSSKIKELNRRVYNQIDPAWKNRSEVTEDIVYRLGVTADGSIVGYKAINGKANDLVNQTPLPSLLYNPVNRVTNEPLAQFKVVFKKEGILEVSPWGEYSNKGIGEKITDANLVKELNEKLYNSIRQNWSVTPTFNKDLKYRVAVNKDGVIADYEPLHQDAFKYLADIPLQQMLSAANLPSDENKEPLAHFKVVFTPKGELEVMTWKGY